MGVEAGDLVELGRVSSLDEIRSSSLLACAGLFVGRVVVVNGLRCADLGAAAGPFAAERQAFDIHGNSLRMKIKSSCRVTWIN